MGQSKRTRFLFLTVALLLLAGSSAGAQETDEKLRVEAMTAEISAEVMSPFCPGRLLSDCPSGAARTLRLEIRRLVSEGKSKSQIIQLLESRYPGQVQAAPELYGFGALAWLLPPAFLALGCVVLWLWMRSASRTESMVEPRKMSKELRARVEKELSSRLED